MIIFIPAPVVAILTFPGVILHEMAHKFFCDYFNIKVFKVSYFRVSSQAGHVIHEPVYCPNQNAIIALAPLLVNSVVCFVLLSPYLISWKLESAFLWKFSAFNMFLIWVGLSCGLSALPSSTDIKNISNDTIGKYTVIKIIVRCLNALGFVGEVIWLFLLWNLTSPIIHLVVSWIG
jgi:hypothetical protein